MSDSRCSAGLHAEDERSVAGVGPEAQCRRHREALPVEGWREDRGLPLGAQVDLTEGRRLNPLSSWKTIQAPLVRAFFWFSSGKCGSIYVEVGPSPESRNEPPGQG